MENARTHFLLCAGAGCVASGSLEVGAAMQDPLRKHGLTGEVRIIETGCLGPCAVGPVAVVYPDGVFYQNLKPEDAAVIVEEHFLKGRVVERLVHRAPATAQGVARLQDISFFREQEKIVLRNCGIIDPLRIDEYIARDGYQALAKVLTGMTPEQVIDVVEKSGLRGRGGAGFPTGRKWRVTRQSKGDVKYVICNGDEGDPGAFMDRSVLEGDPHSIIEAMAIAAYAIGSSQGYVYVRAEYPLAVERLGKALDQARQYGLIGKNIMGTGFDFDLEIRMGSGAFVCGEETALMTSIEGNRGEPRPRPPFPAQKGLWGKPSLLNNVETYANIPAIIMKGAEWYASFGTEKSKGTKVFALAGTVNNTGLVEVPIGSSLGRIIYEVGGGIPGGKKFKAAQMGGPSGGCIPKEHLNVPVDYESLTDLGAIMGSGGLIVMDEDTCMVDMARYFLDFIQDESCGKCPPCRVGTKRMLEIVNRICEGNGQEGDVEKLIDLGNKIKDTALCGLGQTGPNPVLSTIRHFRDEYNAHIREKHCPAGVCESLVRAPCQNACPAGVDVPGYVALISEGRYAEALKLHRNRNPFASVCARVCFHPCESKCRRSTVDESVSIRGLKRFMVEQEVTVQLPEIRESERNARHKVAIIGAGPAGLSCAYFLARLGYRPKVFEAESQPGGMLRWGIPAYRLPRDVITREVRMIEHLGVDIETGMKLGRDFTLKSLKADGYKAVFVGVGTPRGLDLGIPGEKVEGVSDAMRFLHDHNLNGSVSVGKEVVVIGGGNAAVDAARTALRLGAGAVTILYRRTRAEMPAYEEEIEEAEREGLRIRTLVAPVEILSSNGHVVGVKCCRMKLGDYDRSGRRRPERCEDSDFVVNADQVIAAIGQALDGKEICDGISLKFAGNVLHMNPVTGQTSVEWVFAGGDAATGPATVTSAIGGGEKAAVGIHEFLEGEGEAFWRKEQTIDTFFDPEADPVQYPRAKAQMIPVAKRRSNFLEVETPWRQNVAQREAKRCLRCDYRDER
ncbi:MAG: NADH-quinone oxidoreductase subunit NuoF [Candidatus Abyssobacteria bacterium SURF_17]|uniref:NADH-quinone oxidoreductase subunit NuoF n=1 Tax=Candidatus Abyssobacteria bacterium SURF_17 TaxID=2093361 RepID=A0A419ERJ7_9BACT|nr:MAG: NADH-quinone oxidoreductase subunit NuoF [Candidatus Abyssubacteria bacterium SURF_17]